MTIRSIPDVNISDQSVKIILDAMKEIIEVMLGRRGSDSDDQVLTKGDSATIVALFEAMNTGLSHDTLADVSSDDHHAQAHDNDDHTTNYIAESLLDAQSIVAAVSDDTPVAVTVAEDRIVGRISGGNIDDLTATQAKTVLGLDCPLSPTVCTGGEITEGTNAGTFQVAASTAWFRTSASDEAPLAYATKTVEDNIAITDASTTYIIVLNYNSGNPTITISETMPNLTTSIPIGQVYREADNTVHYISGGYNLYNGVARLHMRSKTLRDLELGNGSGGSAIAYSGVNNFTMNAGKAYGGINEFPLAAYNSATTTFIPIYRDGGGGYTKGAARNTIDYAHYDDGTPPLGSTGVGRYSTHWVYKHIDDDHVLVVYGRGNYKLAEAEAELEPSSPDYITKFGCLIGKIVAPQAGGSFTTVQMVTDTIFSGTSVATHNELGGLNDGDYWHLTAAEKASLVVFATAAALGTL